MRVSIVIRTYNEDRHLEELLQKIALQYGDDLEVEVIIVDSGSIDNTLQIATMYDCRIVHIQKDQFTFGRSLNRGCEAARGDYLVFISGHCIPVDERWLINLLQPILHGTVSYTYGRQVGNGDSKFSECQLFNKYYPKTSNIPQEGFFCNNANSALAKEVWVKYKFDEDLTGLEDMELASRIYADGMKIGYVAEAPVYHLHDENWHKIKVRYEREAIALQRIMPQIHITFSDFVRYFFSSVFLDMGAALQEKRLLKNFGEILAFRLMQFWGSYCGNNEHRKLSRAMKENYFYPR